MGLIGQGGVMKRKVYVASSWRNPRNPPQTPAGFHWSDIDPEWKAWGAARFREMLRHPIALAGYARDLEGMRWADVFVGVMPFGRSASLEMGWAAGAGKQTVLLLSDGEPELMFSLIDHICVSLEEVLVALQRARLEDDRAIEADIKQEGADQ